MTSFKLLENTFNRYLALDPEAPEKLSSFEGRVICIDIRGPGKRLYLSMTDNRVVFLDTYDAEPDATIIGSPAALIKLGLRRDTAPLFFSGEVEIQGDTRLGRQFKSLLADMDIDWEEQLSRFVGDIAAHRISDAFDALRSWGRSAAGNFADDIGEYLQEESRDVVSEAEMAFFYQQVDECRDGAERIKARIDRLTEGNKG
ncbi:MAG: sterol-binding protein [Gammaproteobacteria bacterium]|nr:SCP2 sterol-binding domain-containing protein [Gammaproteobacteria bacterium]NNL07323.1 sterol-binding protein [Gammaproteobacteria bacterium]